MCFHFHSSRSIFFLPFFLFLHSFLSLKEAPHSVSWGWTQAWRLKLTILKSRVGCSSNWPSQAPLTVFSNFHFAFLLTFWVFMSVLFNFNILVNFPEFFLLLISISNFFPFLWENILCVISILFNVFVCFYGSAYGLSWRALWMSIRANWFIALFKSSILWLAFIQFFYPFLKIEYWSLQLYCTMNSPFISISFCLMHFGNLLLDVCMVTIVIASWHSL